MSTLAIPKDYRAHGIELIYAPSTYIPFVYDNAGHKWAKYLQINSIIVIIQHASYYQFVHLREPGQGISDQMDKVVCTFKVIRLHH